MTLEKSKNPGTVGEALVGLLEQYKVEHVFGIPGVHTIELYRGLVQSPINHILPRHEQGAAFMADGYARASGKPGVCFLISGPGVTNAMTGLGQAYADSVPILAIASTLAREDLGMGRGRLHDMKDQRAAAETVTKWARTALDPSAIPDLLAQAFTGFETERPRPVMIEVPIDVFPLEAPGDWSAEGPASSAQIGARALDPQYAEIAAQRLAEAERPVLILGGGATDAASEITALAKALSAPALTTIAGKGVVANGDPNFAGSIIREPELRSLVVEADLVLAIGTELASPDFWDGDIEIKGHLIRIDLDPLEFGDQYKPDLALCADAQNAVAQINAALAPLLLTRAPKPSHADLREIRDQIYHSGDTDRAMHRSVLESIRRALPEDAVVAADMTRLAYAGNQIFPVSGPRQWLHPTGFGTLGYALPAAIGAKIALPKTPVAAIAGDYGFQFTCNELATAQELGLSMPIILWNDSALGEIRNGMVEAGMQPIAVNTTNPDFQLLAQAYGCATARPETGHALEEAITSALSHQGPTLIEVNAINWRP